jgi:hypothetical protein
MYIQLNTANEERFTVYYLRIQPSREWSSGTTGALTIRPPTNRPRDISTHTIRSPDKPSAATFYYCDIPSQGGWIVHPPKIVTFRPNKFGPFVTV